MKGLKRVAGGAGAADAKIVPLVNRIGVVSAARELGIAPSTVSKFLKDSGYRKVTKWEKVS